MNIYTNLADSVNYSTRTIVPTEKNIKDYDKSYYPTLYKQYKSKLLAILEALADNNSHDVLGLTFNQVADNPVFYTRLSEGKDAHPRNMLMSLLKTDKAFISRYNNYTVATYLSSNMLSHWKKLCGGSSIDDALYLSSFLNMAAKVLSQNTSFRGIKRVHYAMFGIGSDKSITEEMGQDVYIQSKDNPKGLYNLLQLYNNGTKIENALTKKDLIIDGKRKPSTIKVKDIFFEIVSLSNFESFYKDNHPFAHDNNITLDKIVDAVFDCDCGSLFYTIYENTASDELRRRLSSTNDQFSKRIDALSPPPLMRCITRLPDKEQLFLLEFRKIMKENKKQNRSLYYELLRDKVIPELSSDLVVINGTHQNARHEAENLTRPFVVQFVDFCYNLYNALLTFGTNEFTYLFYGYKTQSPPQNTSYTPQNMTASLNITNPIVLYHPEGNQLEFKLGNNPDADSIQLPIIY